MVEPGSEAAYSCLPLPSSFFLLSEARTQQGTTKATENILPDCPAMAGKDRKYQITQPLGLPCSGSLVENGKFGSAHTILM